MCITFVVGGARSGKSTFAEAKAKQYGEKVAYIATAVVTDAGMADRVKRHRASRPQEWKTIERYKKFDELINDDDFINSDTILIDCITTLICNHMIDSGLDFDKCSMNEVNSLENSIKQDVLSLIDLCNMYKKNLIIVSNEVGLGIVPAYYMGNYFRDISGRINATIAKKADNVYFTAVGIPMKLKSKGVNISCSEDY